MCLLAILGQPLARDINLKREELAKELRLKAEFCARQYALNRCSPETRVPNAEYPCREMELCMAKDSVYTLQAAAALGREAVSEMFGSINTVTLAVVVGIIT